MLKLDCAYSDSVSGEASDVAARADAVSVAIGTAMRVLRLDTVKLYRYVENDHPAYMYARELRVTNETEQELDAMWLQNLRLIVREEDEATFVRRCAVAIRPGAHRGTIFLDDIRLELTYDACETSAISWSLPPGVELDPDEHASLVEEVAHERGIDARFMYGTR